MTFVDVLLVLLLVVTGVIVWRLAFGPTEADRVVAVDLAFVVFLAVVALLSVKLRSTPMLVLVLVATLVGFLATVAAAHLLERRSRP
ncbi:monovalent cation/H+ antiporter complex subunit F [Streptomyces alkaliterrae]|uniref:Pesticidal protein Cry26Aa n=1 Tax=Streptomyces alkaliterrae TaxID=2213162 RepID=A0A5P0YS81_9ACTN|nr:monovalent cation/H+ antiporter complex subunit F [Streptomyces alkaliterrae]MBB1252790.1 pesticidal protein Cry26Aa [Streptomyces alkaliterrae]MBB1259034.1 pesticidal protein Cry26Aa [Streptomyces alkaliterrae]MQS02457.1 pesticidal protein Cry26Aa [Streptomyces alkaliterrae]